MSRRRRRTRTVVSAGSTGAAPSAGGREPVLRFALFGVLGLLLLTPFVVTPGTVYPFVVGKALWSRSLIAVAFALWALLALLHPGYRPPRSWLLVLLVAGYGATVLSAAFGVHPGHSLWSDYERMQGVVDQAHWVVLAVVLASVLHTPRGWRAVLQANLAAGAAMACIVLARALDIGVPYFGALPESSPTRFGGPFGNPGYLSIYMLVNLVLAAGFAARAWATVAPPGDPGGRRAGVFLWATVAALHLAGVVLAGSVGGFAGLMVATGFAALGFAWLCRGRGRVAAVALLVVLATVCTVLGARAVDPGRTTMVALARSAVAWPGGGALRYVGEVHLQRPSVQSRLAAWDAGLAGFTAAPPARVGTGQLRHRVRPVRLRLCGDRRAARPGAQRADRTRRDHRCGRACHLARAVGRRAGCAGACRAPRAAAGARGDAVRGRGAGRTSDAAPVPVRHRGGHARLHSTARVRGAARTRDAAARAAAARPGAARAGVRATRPGGLQAARRACRGRRGGGRAGGRGAGDQRDHSHGRRPAVHGPMVPADRRGGRRHRRVPSAGRLLPEIPVRWALARSWPSLHEQNPEQAGRLLRLADREAAAALEKEPWDWRTAHLLARLYRVVADTRPDYEATARSHLARAHELAPARDVFPAPLVPPADLASSPLPGGRLQLCWRPSPGAGYHVIAQAAESGAWRTIHYAYDPAPGTLGRPRRWRPLPYQGVPVSRGLQCMEGMAVTAPHRRPGALPVPRSGRRPPSRAPVPESVRAGAGATTVTDHAGASLPPRLPSWWGADGPDRVLSGPGVDPSAQALTCRDRYKRPFDLVALAFALVALGPLWLVLGMAIAAAIRLQDGGSVLYRQARLGRGGRIFAMLKFRTMAEDAERGTGAAVGAAGRCALDGRGPGAAPIPSRRAAAGRPRAARRDEPGGSAPRAPGVCDADRARVSRFRTAARRASRHRGSRPSPRARATCSPRTKLRYDLVYIGAMGPWLDIRLCAACVWRALRGTRDGRARPGREATARHAGGRQAQRRDVMPDPAGERRDLMPRRRQQTPRPPARPRDDTRRRFVVDPQDAAWVLDKTLAASGARRMMSDAAARGLGFGRTARAAVRAGALRPLARWLATSVRVEHRELGALLAAAIAEADDAAAWALVSTAARRPDRRAEKIVSRRYRFLWICNPKAASRSLIAGRCVPRIPRPCSSGTGPWSRSSRGIPRPGRSSASPFCATRTIAPAPSMPTSTPWRGATGTPTAGSSSPGTACAPACVSPSSAGGWRRPAAPTSSPIATGCRSRARSRRPMAGCRTSWAALRHWRRTGARSPSGCGCRRCRCRA